MSRQLVILTCNPEALFRVRASQGKTHGERYEPTKQTMKTILIDDWYAPSFQVRINAPRLCPLAASRRRLSPSICFLTAHSEPCRSRFIHQIPRPSRFAHLVEA